MYGRAKAALQELETRREVRDELKTELQACEQQLALARQNQERLQAELENIAEAEAELERLHPQVERQAELESALQEAERDATRLEDVRQSLEREQARLQELRAQLTETQADLKKRDTIREEIETLAEQQAALEERRENVRDRLGDLEAQAAQLQERHAQAVKTEETAQAELQGAKAEVAQLERTLNDLRQGVAERQELEERIAAYRKSLDAAEADYTALSAEIVERRTRLKQVEACLDVLTTTDDEAACPVCEQLLTPEHRRELVARYEKERATLTETLEDLEGKQAQLKEKKWAFRTSVDEWTAGPGEASASPGGGQPCRAVGTTAAGGHRTATGPRRGPGSTGRRSRPSRHRCLLRWRNSARPWTRYRRM